MRTYKYTSQEDWEGGDTTFQPIADIKEEFVLADGKMIQAAGFEISRGERVEFHACVSTQAGCKFACQMCVSGRNGFSRNLTPQEIVHQVDTIAKQFNVDTLDHVVFMGIGEPLDNYQNFCESLRELNSKGYQGKLSFATVGNPQRIRQFADEGIPVRMLWLSLHAPEDSKRQILIPSAKAFSVREIVSAGVRFADKTGAEVRVNYLVYQGFNDSLEDAVELKALLQDTESSLTLQLTEPNDVPFANYKYGTREDINRFRGYLTELGVTNKVVRFLASGRPLQAGCGEFAYTPGS